MAGIIEGNHKRKKLCFGDAFVYGANKITRRSGAEMFFCCSCVYFFEGFV